MLEEHGLTAAIFNEINAHVAEKNLLSREGTMVDATIIEAPPSTKNKANACDPQMHQAKRGNAWHFGMKAHIGADVESGLMHSVHATSANESDVAHTHEVLHGQGSVVHLDAGYTGVHKRPEIVRAQQMEAIRQDIDWQVAQRRHKRVQMAEGRAREVRRALERLKAQVRARVEHPFYVVKNLFRHRKVRYKGLTTNEAQLFSLFGLANLVIAKRSLMASRERCARMKESGAQRLDFTRKTTRRSSRTGRGARV